MSERFHQFCTTLKCPPAGEIFESLRTSPPQSFLYYGEYIVPNSAVPQERVQELEEWFLDRLAELDIPVRSVRLDLIGPEAANFAIFTHPTKGCDIALMEGLTSCVDIGSIVV